MLGRSVLALLCAFVVVVPSSAEALDTATLRTKLAKESELLGTHSGLYVRDLESGRTLFALRENMALAPASNEKLLTTSAALLKLGPDATLRTVVRAAAPAVAGVLDGDVHLVGGGDPYLTTTKIQLLASQIAAVGITHIRGRVVADSSMLDDKVGSYDSGFAFDGDLGGRLAALVVDGGRGKDPALHAAQALHDALKKAHVQLDGRPRDGVAGQETIELAGVDSSPISSVIAAINVPSDNFAAEMLLKDLGARFGGAGSTSAGAAVVRATLGALGIHPRIYDGSGLSRADRTTARQLVRLLELMRAQPVGATFAASLPVAGRTGTLAKRMRATAARDNCRAKTGTLTGVSALSGYCTTAGGGTVAFSFVENQVCNVCAKQVEDRMTAAIARYTGSVPVDPVVPVDPAAPAAGGVPAAR